MIRTGSRPIGKPPDKRQTGGRTRSERRKAITLAEQRRHGLEQQACHFEAVEGIERIIS